MSELRSVPFVELEVLLKEKGFTKVEGKWRNTGGITVTSPGEYWVDVRITTRHFAELLRSVLTHTQLEALEDAISTLTREKDHYHAECVDKQNEIDARIAALRQLLGEEA